MIDLNHWQPKAKPGKTELLGSYCTLQPLQMQHADFLYEASMGAGYEDRFRYLTIGPQSRDQFNRWLTDSIADQNQIYFGVIDNQTRRCEGRQALMRIDHTHGVIEIGSILWGPRIARTRVATESLYLMAKYVFEQLGYRRFEWKCDSLNQPSRNAALRFGFEFEGIFRQHLIIKGKNRDTAWFAMLDSNWPALSKAYRKWLAPSNFDAQGQQIRRLQESF